MTSDAALDVTAWLTGLGLAQYAQAFADNDIDATLLPQLTADDLRDLGVTSVGHRRRLLDAVAALRTVAAPQPPGAGRPAAHEVAAVAPPLSRGPDPAAFGAPGLQRRPLTVMFCDLVGSTALAARVDPEDLREHLNNFRNLLARVVQEHQGWIAQYLGDGVLAYFGYPVAHEHDAELAVSAALAIIDALPSLAPLPGEQGQPPRPPQVRIGVATGLTVIGAALSPDGREDHNADHSAVGQTPNLAARAQAMAEPDTVVVTAETRRLIGGLFECRELGRFELKGITGPQPLWHVTRESPLSSRFDALRAGGQHALVGRDDETQRIVQRLDEVQGGRGRVVVISAEGGLGKSRLAGHVMERVGARQPPRSPDGDPAVRAQGAKLRLVFQCSPYHVSTPWHSVRYYLERTAGIGSADGAEQALDKLVALLQADGGQPASDLQLALLGELLRIKPVPGRTKGLLDGVNSNERRRLTLELLLARLESAARRAHLIVIEDLQWIDPSSAELFGLLFQDLATLPVLVLATMRPGPLPAWLADARSEIVTLDRLDTESTRSLVRAVAHPRTLSPAVEAAVVARCDGVPLFAEELTRACLEGAMVELGTATEEFTRIPSTLVESLLARLDRLAHGRELAPIAAVLGREMPMELLVAVCARASTLDRLSVQRGIRELLDAGVFVTGHSRFGAAVAFRHMLVRDAAYQLLLRRERWRLHALVAQVIETQFSAVAEALPQTVALHWTEAGESEPASRWWERAGLDANQRSAYHEAIAHHHRALEHLLRQAPGSERDLREFELRKSLISPLIAALGFQAAEVGREISDSIVLAERLGPRVSLVTTLALKWMWHGPGGDLRARSELSHRMRDAAVGGTEVERLWAHRFLGTSLVFSGRFREALAEYHAFEALYVPARHARELAYVGPSNHHLMVVVGMAEVATFMGLTQQAQAYRERCLAIADADGRVHNRCQALVFGCCLTAAVAADADALETYANQLHGLTHGAEELPVWRGHAKLFKGLSLVASGRRDEGFAMAATGVQQMQAAGAYNNVWFILHADACCEAGRLDEAEQSLALAQPWRDNGLHWVEAEYLRVRARVRQARGEPLARVQDDLDAALALAQQQGAALFVARAQQALQALDSARSPA